MSRTATLRLVGGESFRTASSGSTRAGSLQSATRRGERDGRNLTLLVTGVLALGLVMVLSASSFVSISEYGSPWSVFERQLLWIVVGSVGFLLARRIDLRRLRQLAIPGLLLSGFLLLAVLAPGLGKGSGGASRWIGFGPFTLQPSELAKLAFALFGADLLARRANSPEPLKTVVRPLVLVLACLGVLIVKQPDLGTAVVLVCITAGLMFTGGIEARVLGWSFGIVVVLGGILSLAAPYRRARLFSFLNPFAHASTSGYQVVQALVATGSGHLLGTGIGGSPATWGLLPNAQTDFIFAIVANELGLVGAGAVIIGFAIFGWLGVRVAHRSQDRFSMLLAGALTCWIVAQAFINIGGVLGVLPETGIPLPFFSFGGSSLVVELVATGLLVNIARHPAAVSSFCQQQLAPSRSRARSTPRPPQGAKPSLVR